jgi:hypothetical protein
MRIQILPLPAVMVGDDLQEPFAVIVDQFEWPIDESASAKWRQFKEQCGARAVLVEPETVEIVDRDAEPAPVPHPSPQVSISMSDTVIREAAAKQLGRDVAKALGLPVRRAREPEPLGYTVVQVVNGSGVLPSDTEDLETRDAAVARQKWLTEDSLPIHDPWVVCKVVPLDDESAGRSLMDDLPPEVRPLAVAVGIADRPVDLRERAREWITGFLAASDDDRVNCVALMLGAADDAIRCAVNHHEQG